MTISISASDTALVIAAGEIDIATAPALQRDLARALGTRSRTVFVDMSRVHFIGATGLSTLLAGRLDALGQGARVIVENPSRRVRRLFDITETWQLFTV